MKWTSVIEKIAIDSCYKLTRAAQLPGSAVAEGASPSVAFGWQGGHPEGGIFACSRKVKLSAGIQQSPSKKNGEKLNGMGRLNKEIQLGAFLFS